MNTNPDAHPDLPWWLHYLRRVIGLSSLALALASLSVIFERRTSEVAVVGNVCGPLTNEACTENRLAAGFPIPYLYDRPSISVAGAINIAEDDFRFLPFLLDVLIYLAVLFAIFRFVEVRRGRPAFEPVERRTVPVHQDRV